jgi:hypothetical protein
MNTVRYIPAVALATCMSSVLLLAPGRAAGQANQQPAPAKLSKVTGTLVSENGQPIRRQPLLLFLVYWHVEGKNELVAERPKGQGASPVVTRPDNEKDWPKAKTDDAGRFMFDGVPAFPTFAIQFGADYDDALKLGPDGAVRVKGSLFAFEVKEGADLKMGTIVTSSKAPAPSK